MNINYIQCSSDQIILTTGDLWLTGICQVLPEYKIPIIIINIANFRMLYTLVKEKNHIRSKNDRENFKALVHVKTVYWYSFVGLTLKVNLSVYDYGKVSLFANANKCRNELWMKSIFTANHSFGNAQNQQCVFRSIFQLLVLVTFIYFLNLKLLTYECYRSFYVHVVIIKDFKFVCAYTVT